MEMITHCFFLAMLAIGKPPTFFSKNKAKTTDGWICQSLIGFLQHKQVKFAAFMQRILCALRSSSWKKIEPYSFLLWWMQNGRAGVKLQSEAWKIQQDSGQASSNSGNLFSPNKQIKTHARPARSQIQYHLFSPRNNK